MTATQDAVRSGTSAGLSRRTGHPAFWFMGGPLAWVRIYSKHLALQITAKQAGVLQPAPGKPAEPDQDE